MTIWAWSEMFGKRVKLSQVLKAEFSGEYLDIEDWEQGALS